MLPPATSTATTGTTPAPVPTPDPGVTDSSAGSSTSESSTPSDRTATPDSSSSTTTRERKEDRSGTKGLDAGLRRALIRARQEAPEGIRLRVTSGYRPASTQERLWKAAIRQYGSRAEARKWVLPPEDSSHVQGAAVDIGPREGARWLELNGARFGLCRTYRNEWWHFEDVARDGDCPPMAASAAAATAD
ncbi:M15 family metallopeptidase [Luteipulveratus halotolerans]|uniref:M15 family metallopeptidase n=1 Tax=Luteipulveratus halotolerans TaxID=1631356 RepID=UPI0009E56D52|nr:M15 family metallopeptidase [Luteipulveratus halotolerans]